MTLSFREQRIHPFDGTPPPGFKATCLPMPVILTVQVAMTMPRFVMELHVVVIIISVPPAIVVPVPSIMRIAPATVFPPMTILMPAPMPVVAIISTVSVIAAIAIVVTHGFGLETNIEFRIPMFGIGRQSKGGDQSCDGREFD